MQPANNIVKLPKEVADKIAAGEVVDRPLSVVKELLENAIDAGANSIIVEIKNGGKSYIRITDNGCGIPKHQLLTAFERHATSKIRTAEDLDSVVTLGFRGEALASISAVSRVEVITKTPEETVGQRLIIAGSELVTMEDTGAPEGTTIIVTDLFYNTPARQKFLKSDGAESTLILDFLSKMAVAYSGIRFRVMQNGRVVFSTAGKGNVPASILTVFSKEIHDPLLAVSVVESPLSLEAFVSAPTYTRTSRKQQLFFVNGRYIKSKVLEEAVEEAYFQRIPEGRYPAVFLFLSLAPDSLDVNIHPNKKEVRFEDPAGVRRFVSRSIAEALAGPQNVPEIPAKALFRYEEPFESRREFQPKEREIDINELLSTKRASQMVMEAPPALEIKREVVLPKETELPAPIKNNDFLRNIRVLDSVFGTYILGTDEENLYFIDQHAAHERVFYERLLAGEKRREKGAQLLLVPLILETSAAVAAQPDRLLQALGPFGFEVEVFGAKSFIIKEIPSFMTQEEAREFLEAFLDQAEENKVFSDARKMEKIIMDSCKSAVKGNSHLDRKEMEKLLEDLSKAENPFSCPHGRPTFIKMTKAEMEKLFYRV